MRLSRVGSRNLVLDGGADPPKGRGNFWGLSTLVKCIGSLCCGVRAKTAESIAMPFWDLTYEGPRKHLVDWGHV